jgi:phosphate transport system substrate-binding protein
MRITKIFICLSFISIGFYSCKNKVNKSSDLDTILTGKIELLVDESFAPVIQQEIDVFENIYDADIKLVAKSEAEIMLDLVNKTSQVAVLSRKLNEEEHKIFQSKKITPVETAIATDAVVFIKNRNSTDSIIDPQTIFDFLQGKPTSIKGLVFDNLNGSSVRYLLEKANVKSIPTEGVFSFKNSNEVIDYVAQNDGLIGVVGLNWLLQPKNEMRSNVKKLLILSVKNAENQYVYPSQETLADESYPLARDLYIINCQGYSGLGMGFKAFTAGDKGQRIILNSGLLPIKMPGRKLRINNKIESK